MSKMSYRNKCDNFKYVFFLLLQQLTFLKATPTPVLLRPTHLIYYRGYFWIMSNLYTEINFDLGFFSIYY